MAAAAAPMSPPGPAPAPAAHPIVVGVDFSEQSEAALARALEIAVALAAKLVLVHAVDLSLFSVHGVNLSTEAPSVAERAQTSARTGLEDLARRFDPQGTRIAATDVRVGGAAPALLEAATAHQARMIVVGTHGRTGISWAILGSVAERVVRLAPCHVLVVHARPPDGPRGAEG